MSLSLTPASASDCERSEGFLQSGFWGAFKSEFGWKARHFLLDSGAGQGPLLVLERRIGKGLSFAYVPHGPEADVPEAERAEFLAGIAEALRPSLSPLCLFVRFDPPWFTVGARLEGQAGEGELPARAAAPFLRPALGAPLRRAAADVQPPDTVLLDLSRPEEGILAAMKPKWRYNIRLAEKKGVVVEERGAGALPDFYRLYEATASRDRIALHPERYYARLFSLAAAFGAAGTLPRPELRLWVALHEGEALAAIVTLYRGSRAIYLYGASSDAKRSLMPAYALQWAAIRAAKASGCSEYDFYGIPPTDDPAHAMAGLYRFKTGFGGEVVHRAGSWDYPLRHLLYGGFRLAEAARGWYYKDLRKRLGRPLRRGGGD
jgi:lipid II:glycine glycyltransferase (peptidoglycan interpeptide bridge formation enzyme)